MDYTTDSAFVSERLYRCVKDYALKVYSYHGLYRAISDDCDAVYDMLYEGVQYMYDLIADERDMLGEVIETIIDEYM